MTERVRRLVVPGVLACAAALIALVGGVWLRSGARVHPGGDPGGRLMARIAPVVRVLPGFGHSGIPWIGFPCDFCQFPVRYAVRIEPRWDSCDGMAGTFGWDPVVVQAGFRWAGSSRALMGLLDERLRARGWARGAAPSWGDDAQTVWIGPRGPAPAREFAPGAPLPGGNHQWMVLVEARPQGRLVRGC